MFYFLYQTTNLVNQKIYVGVHKTLDLNDGYLGSGNYLRRAIRKHGITNFKRGVLEYFDSQERMFAREVEVVNLAFVSRKDTYNMSVGGYGGSISLNRKPFTGSHTLEAKEKIGKAQLGVRKTEATIAKLIANSFSKREPEKQKEHAKIAGAKRWDLDEGQLQESKEKISNSLKTRNASLKEKGIDHHLVGFVRPKIDCPYCDVSGSKNVMLRWHFDNCKFKNMVYESEVYEPLSCEDSY